MYKYLKTIIFGCVVLSIIPMLSHGQIIGWEDAVFDSTKTKAFVYSPRIGYSYYSSSLAEVGYGLYICNEDNTIEDVKENNLTNLRQISNSFNISVEYTRKNSQSIWAPKFSYVIGYSLIAFRTDLLWQTNNFKVGYLSNRIGAGISFYDIGLFAMKNIQLRKDNPFAQNWGLSFSTIFYGAKKKSKVRN
jgi:hypothetical protein